MHILYSNNMPFYIRDLSICGLWYPPLISGDNYDNALNILTLRKRCEYSESGLWTVLKLSRIKKIGTYIMRLFTVIFSTTKDKKSSELPNRKKVSFKDNENYFQSVERK